MIWITFMEYNAYRIAELEKIYEDEVVRLRIKNDVYYKDKKGKFFKEENYWENYKRGTY